MTEPDTVTRKPFERKDDGPRPEYWSYAHQGTGLTRHGKCGLVWWQSGNQTSHCGGCCKVFTSLTAFDIHQELDEDGRVTCHDPESMTDGDGRLRFAFSLGHHTGETAPGYWGAVPKADRVFPPPGSTVVDDD